MRLRIAAIEVSHWHSLHDAAYLRHAITLPDVELRDPTWYDQLAPGGGA